MNKMITVPVAALASASTFAAPSIVSAASAGDASSRPGMVSETTIAAIDRVRTAGKLWERLYRQYDTAKDIAVEKHGDRPDGLIAWRNHHQMEGSEIERVRDEFLKEGEDSSIIEQEYREAKKRYRAAIRSGKDWDKRVGIDLISNALDKARAESDAAERALGTLELHSVADASAIVCFIHWRLERWDACADPWEMAALGNATSFLKRWMGKTRGRARREGRRSAATAA